ncbi:hypothetical protein GE09DRAFT_93170 [Coniochaeta sp. 2T2.1]|nr:hypothetical protein GE09DRAFT_93170 [Coniochaeta sp. 2T2.1]
MAKAGASEVCALWLLTFALYRWTRPQNRRIPLLPSGLRLELGGTAGTAGTAGTLPHQTRQKGRPSSILFHKPDTRTRCLLTGDNSGEMYVLDPEQSQFGEESERASTGKRDLFCVTWVAITGTRKRRGSQRAATGGRRTKKTGAKPRRTGGLKVGEVLDKREGL